MSALTRCETLVLEHLSRGRSRQEIADRLVLSLRTVDFHLNNAYRKLKVSNCVQAVNECRRQGILTEPRP